MFSSQVCIIIWALLAFTEAQPLCDPQTQYMHNGQCCLMCEPGTVMVSPGECMNPVCKDCDEDEYMDKYNTETKCERQPYCDLNRNFQIREHSSKTEHVMCLCKKGFHCSSQSCITCVPHTVCKAGHGAKTIGDHTHDTVCEICPDGTFSDEVSWDGRCKNKTKCLDGYETQNGSPETDNNCVGKTSWHIGVIVVIALIFACGFVVLLCFKLRQNKKKFAEAEQPKQDEEKLPIAHPEDNTDRPCGVVTTPTDDNTHSTHPFTSLLPCSPEVRHSGIPEENEDPGKTDNGKELCQDGKDYIISQTETQAHNHFNLISINSELV